MTGRLVRTGQLGQLPDILALPELGTPARSPRFKYQFSINEEKVRAQDNMMALLRVYTVDIDTKDLVVIGSCLIEIFDKTKVSWLLHTFNITTSLLPHNNLYKLIYLCLESVEGRKPQVVIIQWNARP